MTRILPSNYWIKIPQAKAKSLFDELLGILVYHPGKTGENTIGYRRRLAMIEINIETTAPIEAIDITPKVEKALQDDGIKSGIAVVISLHTTTGLAINEADPALMKDIMNLLERIAPEKRDYLHDHGERNAHAHLRAVLTGNSVTIPVAEGRLVAGTWQRILFFEFDGPRKRKIYIKIASDMAQ